MVRFPIDRPLAASHLNRLAAEWSLLVAQFDARERKLLASAVITLLFTVLGSVSSGQDTKGGEASHTVSVPDEYSKLCEGEGPLAVFGKLLDLDGKARAHAMVSLERNHGAAGDTYTAKDGKYCIRYSPGADITSLYFSDGGATCVENISGNESHYINKLFDKSCSSLDGRAQMLSLRESKDAFDRVAKIYVAIQIVLKNTSGQSIQLLTARFERNESEQSNAASGTSDRPRAVIIPTDTRIVQSIEPESRNVGLFSFGPVSIFSFAMHARSERVRSLIADMAIRGNEIIPNGSAVIKVVFVPRSIFPPDSFQDANTFVTAQKSLGNLVIVANRLASNGEINETTTVGGGQLSDFMKAAASAQGEPISLVVPVN
jgi:hypothetical protein